MWDQRKRQLAEMTEQILLFDWPVQQRRIRKIAFELYDKMVELRRAGAKVRQEGQDVVVDGARMSLRDFRRLYGVAQLSARNRS